MQREEYQHYELEITGGGKYRPGNQTLAVREEPGENDANRKKVEKKRKIKFSDVAEMPFSLLTFRNAKFRNKKEKFNISNVTKYHLWYKELGAYHK